MAYPSSNPSTGFRAPYAQSLSHATVLPSPTNDTSCLRVRTRHRWEPKGGTGIEGPVIGGVLGGLLLFFMALIFCMCWRRRSEKHSNAGYGNGNVQEESSGSGGAGWSYMANLVPGLTPANAPAGTPTGRRRRRGLRTRRNDGEGDVELPSYGQSQKDAKGPPKYLHEFEDDEYEEEYLREDGNVSLDGEFAKKEVVELVRAICQ